MLTIALLGIFFACLALLLTAGLWSNALTLFNVVVAGLLAMNFFEPLADYLNGELKSYTYLWDFLSLWGVFAVSMIVLRSITDTLSKVKVRFKGPVNTAGGIFFACWVGWMLVCFTLTTLHTAPLAKNSFRGSFKPKERMFLGLAPDRVWLGLTNALSTGAFSHSKSQPFDPGHDFIEKYSNRRAAFEKEPETRTKG